MLIGNHKGVLLELRRAPFIIIYDNKAENR